MRPDDEVVFAPRLFDLYREKILVECRKVTSSLREELGPDHHAKLEALFAASADVPHGTAHAATTTTTTTTTCGTFLEGLVAAASARDIVDLVLMEGGVSPVAPAWIVDWKGLASTRENLEKVSHHSG